MENVRKLLDKQTLRRNTFKIIMKMLSSTVTFTIIRKPALMMTNACSFVKILKFTNIVKIVKENIVC